jgi:hypothetical protein
MKQIAGMITTTCSVARNESEKCEVWSLHGGYDLDCNVMGFYVV